jgi:alkanesulfonate monooxygenase SsuD/methylene tetrahydromethanopterin reductase-like flavin-dependent oxidoreductase (luciferase family)
VLEVESGGRAGVQVGAEQRAKIEAAFGKIRKSRIDDADERAALAQLVAALIDTP